LIGQWIKIRTRDHTGQKSYSTTSEASRVFPARVIVLWQENVWGTRNASFAGNRYNVVFKYL